MNKQEKMLIHAKPHGIDPNFTKNAVANTQLAQDSTPSLVEM